MPVFEIRIPDGSTLDIEAADEGRAIAGAKKWYAENNPQKLAEKEVRQNDAFWGRGGRFERFTDMVTDPFGVFDEMRGAGAYARGLVTDEDAGEAYTKETELARAERRVAREDNGYLGTAAEVVGGLGMGGPKLAAPVISGAWNTAKAAFKAGAAGGAIAGAGNAEGDLADRAEGAVTGGLVGGVLGPVASNIVVPGAARLWGGGKSAYEFAKRQLAAANAPEQAAIDAVADQMLQSGTDPARLRARVAPPVSKAFAKRGLTDEDMADIVSRQLQGEDAATVAASYGISEKIAKKYLGAYRLKNPAPTNMLDLAVEEQGAQGAMPLLRRQRANFVMAPDQNIAQALENRQLAQPGRVADMIRQSKIETPEGDFLELEDGIKYLANEARTAERQAYAEVRRQKADIDVSDVVREARRRAAGRQGEVGEQMNKAIDGFFEPELRSSSPSPMAMLRLQEAREKLTRMQRDGTDYERMARQRRLVRTLEAQEDFSNPLKQVKVGKPITDVQRFIDARDELSQMVKRSMQDGQDTPLTAELTRLRTELNAAARRSNPALTAADARFHDDRTVEELIKGGEKLGVSLNPRSREAMRDFETLTPTQQEVVRTAFENNMATAALNTTDGNAAARRFGNEGFRQLVEGFYPKTAGKAIYERGQALIRNLRAENIKTNVGHFVTNSRNSPTALIQNDVGEAMENARAGADLALGRFGKLTERIADKLARQYGAEAAGHQLRIVTETDPAKLLPLMRRLEASFATASQRQGRVHQARALRAINRPGVGLAVGVMSGKTASQPNK